MKRLTGCFLLVALLCGGSAFAADGIADQIAKAKPGTAVELPAGNFEISSIRVPKDISIAGAGYGKTTLNVTGQQGLVVSEGGGCSISDLTVTGAENAGILVESSANVKISRVRVLKCMTGIMVADSSQVQIINAATAQNRTGIVLNSSKNSAVINCSLVGNTSLGMSLGQTADCAAFNNLLVNSPIGVFVADNNENLALDYNFYLCSYIGKGRDIPIPTVPSWSNYTGFDTHSLSLALNFEETSEFTFKPATPLNWSPDRAVTSGWGVANLNGFAAPKSDIDGSAYVAGPCAGAWEAKFNPNRPAAGTFTVADDDGMKSAGLYDANGRNVAFLFNLLPLHRGEYQFWLPTRDWQGKAIPAGSYELRMTEADLSLSYVGHPGNTTLSLEREAYASTGIKQVVYDSKGRPILVLHWSESYQNFRGFDSELTKQRWSLPGCKNALGAASDGNSTLYAINEADKTNLCLRKLDEETGKVIPWAANIYSIFIPKDTFSASFGGGLAELNGTLYFADNGGNKLFTSPVKDPEFKPAIDVTAPACPTADRTHNLIWVISEQNKVLGLDPSGVEKYRFVPGLNGIRGLAVSNNRMALLTVLDGKIRLYDCSNPGDIRQTGSIGKGDGPYGPVAPDRFRFQRESLDQSTGDTAVALGPDGDVMVTDQLGVKLFGPDGSFKRKLTGIWAQYIETGLKMPDGKQQIIEKTQDLTFLLDPKTESWQPEGYWKVPENFGDIEFLFRYDGEIYGVHKARNSIGIARYENFIGVPLIAYSFVKDGKMCYLTDFSKDFEDPVNWTPLLDDDGKPISRAIGRACIRNERGDILMVSPSVCVPFEGIDENGMPIYDWANRRPYRLTYNGGWNIISPYDYKTKEVINGTNCTIGLYDDGDFTATVSLKKTGHASGFANWAGTDIAGFDATGEIQWLQPCPHITDVQGAKVIDGLSYSVSVPTQELQVFGKDGMYLGRANVPPELYWQGMWLDNRCQFTAFKGSDGSHHIVYGNFNDCTMWWMKVDGIDGIRRRNKAITIDNAAAERLAAAPQPSPITPPKPPVTRVTVTRLDAPMTIDGSMDKWREVVPTPQIIITPETGKGIDGPADASAVVRLAYEGRNLYVQVLKFDNVIALHQLVASHYLQDSIEMALNSFVKGIKINVTHTRDLGDVVYRDGWFIKAKDLDKAKAPRKIYVLDNAENVPERKLIEKIYGTDLSDCKVIVSEYKVPLTEETFEQRENMMPEAAPGSTMYIGFAIDDNDSPGADIQKMMTWPATYGTFAAPDAGAIAVFGK